MIKHLVGTYCDGKVGNPMQAFPVSSCSAKHQPNHGDVRRSCCLFCSKTGNGRCAVVARHDLGYVESALHVERLPTDVEPGTAPQFQCARHNMLRLHIMHTCLIHC